MPIPLYISPNTPLPGPADFSTPIMAAFQARNRRMEQEKDAELRRQQMQQQVTENAKDRSQRASERKDTNAYNQGMLELYKGDRAGAEQRRLEEAENKVHQEYLLAYMKGDEAGMTLAEQKIAQLRRKQAQAPVQAQQEPPPGIGGVGLNSSRLF